MAEHWLPAPSHTHTHTNLLQSKNIKKQWWSGGQRCDQVQECSGYEFRIWPSRITLELCEILWSYSITTIQRQHPCPWTIPPKSLASWSSWHRFSLSPASCLRPSHLLPESHRKGAIWSREMISLLSRCYIYISIYLSIYLSIYIILYI